MRLSSFAALVVATLTLGSSAFAGEKKAPAAAPTHKPKAQAHVGKKHPSKVAKLDTKDAAKKTESKPSEKPAVKADAAEKKDEPKKDEPKKTAQPDDAEQPPPEMSGYFPQAKLANKKKVEKKDEKSEAKADPKKDDAKKDDAKSDEAKKKKGMSPAEFQNLQKKGAAEKKSKLKACLHPAVSFARLGQATDVMFPLTTCGGGTAPGAVDNLSILARPYDVAAPGPSTQPVTVLSLPKKMAKPSKALATVTDEVAPGIRRVDPGLVTRLQAIADKFPGKTITLVSGYRPASKGSPHQAARAFDIRIDGVTNEALVAYCRTLQDTGCGYYPNSYFVHVDVRPAGAGHVYWIDTSGPGEKPNYVKQWPLPLPDKTATAEKKPADEAPATTDQKEIGSLEDAEDEPPAMVAPPVN